MSVKKLFHKLSRNEKWKTICIQFSIELFSSYAYKKNMHREFVPSAAYTKNDTIIKKLLCHVCVHIMQKMHFFHLYDLNANLLNDAQSIELNSIELNE